MVEEGAFGGYIQPHLSIFGVSMGKPLVWVMETQGRWWAQV